MIVSLCDIVFMCDQRYYSTLKFCPSFKLFRHCPLLKVAHAYQNFLEQTLKAPLSRSMKQLGVQCVKRDEGFCHFDCSICYFDWIKLSWYSWYTLCSCSSSNDTYVGCFGIKKYLVTLDVFRGAWVGETEIIILTFYVTNWVWMLPLNKCLWQILNCLRLWASTSLISFTKNCFLNNYYHTNNLQTSNALLSEWKWPSIKDFIIIFMLFIFGLCLLWFFKN